MEFLLFQNVVVNNIGGGNRGRVVGITNNASGEDVIDGRIDDANSINAFDNAIMGKLSSSFCMIVLFR